ncbi:sensor domain-containing diguanylate cyclase [Pseudoalteromonas piscicida]|uniref:sensor domain-containing diguanylate cyclase n=1 Tax=Pseudoalteromonas piscicida TaxID=43662 RepID=UPI000E360C59|nr:diguanylate cyclase [Pseudoalteromonas piscicida]AXQ97208.1 sensor domain-containing diguanylate cyclase [Pseudoalteromonas piscicida]
MLQSRLNGVKIYSNFGRKLILLLAFIYGALFLFSPSTFALDNSCLLTTAHSDTISLTINTTSYSKVERGENIVSFVCDLSEDSVFSFVDVGINHYQWQVNSPPPVKFSQPAFIIPKGKYIATLALDSMQIHTPRFRLMSMPQFIWESQKNSLVMGTFYGLCFTLICYVLIMGSRLNDPIFGLYGAYIFCLCGFVLFQEGQLNLFISSHYKPLLKHAYLLSIGLTVLSATWFMLSILMVDKQWPKLTLSLKSAAAIVMLLSVLKMSTQQAQLSYLFSQIMAYITLVIVATLFVLSALQTKRKIGEASLVFAALSLVLVGMVFRVLLVGYSPFMQRYALIFAFAIESLLLAVAVSKRIGRLRQQKQQAENEANYDQLCAIFNRRGWHKQANVLVEQFNKRGGVLALFYVDLDKFKLINDQFGHDAGDKALTHVATFLSSGIRKQDIVGRLGGDEFAALCLFDDIQSAEEKAQQLQQQLNTLQFSHGKQKVAIQGSVGRAFAQHPITDISDLIAQADKQMYQQKTLS